VTTRKKARRLRIAFNRKRRDVWHSTARLDRYPSILDGRPLYYGRDGWPMTSKQWTRRFELFGDYRIVGKSWFARRRVRVDGLARVRSWVRRARAVDL
jgi:hypothetical protein